MFLTSCKEEDFTLSEHFFLRNNNADMPVYVEGNTVSNTFIVVLHGGPGDDVLVHKELFKKFTNEIEENYAMVFWQQRCAGSSQGNVDTDKIQLSDYVEDLEQLIVLLKHKYGSQINIFLLGHSWGGALGSMFLLKDDNQKDIRGWIEICGNHDWPLTFTLEKQKMISTGNNQISIGNNTASWESLLNEVEQCNLDSLEGKLNVYLLTDKAYKLMVDVDSVLVDDFTTKETLNGIFFQPYNPFSNFINLFVGAKVNKEYMDLSLSDELYKIKVPSLFLYGGYDFTVPASLGYDAYNRISTEEKDIIILEKSEHWPMRTEPEKCSSAIITFIEKVK